MQYIYECMIASLVDLKKSIFHFSLFICYACTHYPFVSFYTLSQSFSYSFQVFYQIRFSIYFHFLSLSLVRSLARSRNTGRPLSTWWGMEINFPMQYKLRVQESRRNRLKAIEERAKLKARLRSKFSSLWCHLSLVESNQKPSLKSHLNFSPFFSASRRAMTWGFQIVAQNLPVCFAGES